MPVSFLSIEQRENHGRYTGELSTDELARYFHLDDTDRQLIAQRRGAHNWLGFAVQLCTVRYLGTFLEDPLAVPSSVLSCLAQQLHIEVEDNIYAYSTGEQRWQHATEIRLHYGYVDFTEPRVGFRLTRWLYALCWTGTERPRILFERATTWLLTHKVLLPSCSTLERYIAKLDKREQMDRKLRFCSRPLKKSHHFFKNVINAEKINHVICLKKRSFGERIKLIAKMLYSMYHNLVLKNKIS